MVKSTTIDSFQASLSDDESERPANPLADLAERMVRERGDSTPEDEDESDA